MAIRDFATNELRATLELLTGTPCWSVIAGAGTGSTIHLSFGARIPRLRPIWNDMLSAEENAFEGELDLFIECAWRLEQGDGVLCGSTDDERNDGPMVQGLSRLIDQLVISVDLHEPIPDVAFHFSQDLCLRVFCDRTNLETNDDNYSVRVGDTITRVCARGRIAVERTDESRSH